jgi:hypothetical protein
VGFAGKKRLELGYLQVVFVTNRARNPSGHIIPGARRFTGSDLELAF